MLKNQTPDDKKSNPRLSKIKPHIVQPDADASPYGAHVSARGLLHTSLSGIHASLHGAVQISYRSNMGPTRDAYGNSTAPVRDSTGYV